MAETPAVIPSGGGILAQLGLNAEDVLKAPNVESTILAPVAPVSDALGIFKRQEEAYGVSGLNTAYQTALANRMKGEQLAKQEQLTIEGRAKKLGVLRGEQQQAGQQATADIATLLQSEQLAQTALSTAQGRAQKAGELLYNEYQTKVNLQLQFPGLDINPLTDSFSKVSGKLEDFQKEQKKQAEKESYKEALRSLGLSTSGNRKKLEERLRKANKETFEKTKKMNDLQMQSMELSIASARKALNAPSVDEQLNDLWGDQAVSSADSTGASSVDSMFNQIYG